MAYAERTEVAPDKSRAEIEKTLQRYNATHFGYLSAPDSATIVFVIGKYQVRFTLPVPPESEFAQTDSGKTRTPTQMRSACEQEERRRWRALALCIKAKLEAVETGITTIDQEFMAHIVMPGTSQTVGDVMLPRIHKAIEAGTSAVLLEWKP